MSTTTTTNLLYQDYSGVDGRRFPSHSADMIRVLAPCDMEAGYTFLASAAAAAHSSSSAADDGGSVGAEDDVPVTVPAGGVRKGQVLVVARTQQRHSPIGSVTNLNEMTPLMVHGKGAATTTHGNSTGTGNGSNSSSSSNNSVGVWKDPWWDCFRFGVFHVSLWNACCCPQLLAAQVMTRLRLDWCADPTTSNHRNAGNLQNHQQHQHTFHRVLLIVIFYWLVSTLTAPPSPTPTVHVVEMAETGNGVEEIELEVEDTNIPPHQALLAQIIYRSVTICFSLYTLLILTKLRHRVRRHYRIPPHFHHHTDGSNNLEDNVALEDCCMAFWCGCCSVAQLARQTVDYASEPAACCSSTGLLSPPHQPSGGFLPKSHSVNDVYVV